MSSLFATCSFYEFRPEMGVPVRSSRGYPRFALKYPLIHAMPSTFPNQAWLRGVGKDEFYELYAEKIRNVGAEALRAQAEKIRWDEAHAQRDDRLKDMPVVLLCFERWDNPKKQPEYCHRHAFAAAWTELTGEEVPEFGAMPRKEIRADEQNSLF